MKDIKSMNLDELKEVCTQMGEKPFHAKQLYGWIHQKLAPSYQEMTTLSKGFRQKLEEAYPGSQSRRRCTLISGCRTLSETS